jgi:flagellar biosynthetic protein FlhB
MSESFEEKNELPTPKKREDARRKGQVARSRELPSIAVLMSGLIALLISGAYMYSQIQIMTGKVFSTVAGGDLNHAVDLIFVKEILIIFILIMAPLMAANFATAIFANVLQVGFMASIESIKPKLSKLDPIKGSKRLLSMQSVNELFKSLSKLGIVGTVAYFSIKAEMENVYSLIDMELPAIMSYILYSIMKIFIKCVLAMIVIVVADYAFQKWQFEKQLKMSKKEIRDELKSTEGDPLVKSRIRSIQMEMARKRMMQDVPQADVVITNPTHLAVAIQYDGTAMGAPKVVAKGAGSIALKIKEIARENQIPVVEDKPLARSLYKMVEIGGEIPGSLYQAVAGVLAYVYGLKNTHPVS